MTGLFKTIEGVALVEQRCGRRIDVLGAGIAKRAAAKSDETSRRVGDRKHQTVDELVLAGAGHQTALLKQTQRDSRARRLRQRVDGIRRHTQVPPSDALGGNLARGEIIPRDLAALGIVETLLEELRCPGVDPGQQIRVHVRNRIATLRRGGPARLQLDAGAFGQPLHRLRKRQVLAHLDELDHVAAGATGKTFENLLGRADVHTRRVVFVERTETQHLPTLPLETDVFGHHVDDIVCLLHAADRHVVEYPCHQCLRTSFLKRRSLWKILPPVEATGRDKGLPQWFQRRGY